MDEFWRKGKSNQGKYGNSVSRSEVRDQSKEGDLFFFSSSNCAETFRYDSEIIELSTPAKWDAWYSA